MTVSRWCDRHGIDTRKANFEKHGCHHFNDGYEIFSSSYDDERDVVPIHRLVMVSEVGYTEVVDKDVHHKNGVPWDNRPENLALMDRKEHISYHRANGDI
jgi:hypothetical protein